MWPVGGQTGYQSSQGDARRCAPAARYLFGLGCICRHSCGLLGETRGADTPAAAGSASLDHCREVMLAFYHLPAGGPPPPGPPSLLPVHCLLPWHNRMRELASPSALCSVSGKTGCGGVGAGEVKLRDKALQALGQLFISRPALMLLDASLEVTASALAPAAPLLLKHRMLSNLTELLKARRPRFISFYPVHPASRLCQYRFLHVVPGPRAPPST